MDLQHPASPHRPLLQVTWQAPQLSALLARFASHPSPGVSLQSSKPLVQEPTTQAPAWHAAVAFNSSHALQLSAPQPNSGSLTDTHWLPHCFCPSLHPPTTSSSDGAVSKQAGTAIASPTNAKAARRTIDARGSERDMCERFIDRPGRCRKLPPTPTASLEDPSISHRRQSGAAAGARRGRYPLPAVPEAIPAHREPGNGLRVEVLKMRSRIQRSDLASAHSCASTRSGSCS